MKKVLFGLVLAAVALPLSAQQKPVYLDASKPIEERVEDACPDLSGGNLEPRNVSPLRTEHR